MNEDPTLQFGVETPAPQPNSATEWGGFHLLARVGAGGFGEVYRAWDPTLQREVALKLLLAGTVGGDDEYQAVLREARALASVKHPNIVSIYGVDRHEGRVGFWTDFVRGKTLSAVLGDQGAFGYREAAIIGLDVTRALSAVHRAGLLHRDIKAENVMREEGGRILLMDFGLSTLPHRSTELSGTLNYMAPELLRASPASVQADLYAVGILLYFLVTGTYPARLSGLSIQEAATKMTQRMPLIDQRSDLPESFLRVVNRAIDLDPARRFQSAGEMAEALAESIGAASPVPPIVAAPEKKQRSTVRLAIIAVFVLAIVFRSRIIHLFHSDNTSHTVEDSSDSDPANSDERYQKAQALLLKSYNQNNIAAAIYQFNAIVKDDPNYSLAWAGLGSAHLIQYKNSHDSTLLDRANTEANTAIRSDKNCAPAYVTLARMAAMHGDTALGMTQAQKAISLDPNSADGHRALSDVYAAEGRNPEALAEMLKAQDLAPDDWRFPMNLGSSYLLAGNLEKARAEYEHAVKLAPDNAVAFLDLGMVDLRQNKLEDANANLEKSLQLDPQSGVYQELGALRIREHRFQDAVAANQKAVAMNPTDYGSWADLADSYWYIPDNRREAVEAYKKAIDLGEAILKKEPRDATIHACLGDYYVHVGDKDRSRTMLREALLLSSGDSRVNFYAGEAYEMLGDRAEAIKLISSIVDNGYSLQQIEADPDIAGLLQDPAFQAALRQHSVSGTNKPIDTKQ